MTVHTYKDSHSQIRIPIGIGLGVVLIGVVTGVLYLRARSEINQVALSAQPKGVSTVTAARLDDGVMVGATFFPGPAEAVTITGDGTVVAAWRDQGRLRLRAVTTGR